MVRGQAKSRRILHDRCLGAIIDVQEFFLSQVDPRLRSALEENTKNFARLLAYFRVPTIVTLERPLEQKGTLPLEVRKHLGNSSETFQKDYFDLTKEKSIRNCLARLNKKQIIIAGCETDVCVLQSCLGLLALGYETYLIEDLLFSSSRDVAAAIARMQAEGAILLSYKSLYYELLEAVEGGRHAERMLARFGPFPDDLSDCAAR